MTQFQQDLAQRRSEPTPLFLPGTRLPRTSPTSSTPVVLFVLLLAGFTYRLVLGHFFSLYGGDAPEYTSIAKNLTAGHGYSLATQAPYVPTDVRVPAYPVFLAVGFLFGQSHWAVVTINALLGTAATVFVWLIARGLRVPPSSALVVAGVAALVPATASFAGSAYSENLSVPALLAFVYFVLVRPPHSSAQLFVLGSVLAWLVALTRDELVVFVTVVGIVAARRMRLRALGSIGLVLCFLVGPSGWVLRNAVQVHRLEYADSVIVERELVFSVNPSFNTPVYRQGQNLLDQRAITQAQRTQYRNHAYQYVRWFLGHHFPTFVKNKVKDYAEALFPPPVFAFTFTPTLTALPWTLALLVEYAFAADTLRRWWTGGRRADVVSIMLLPVFIAIGMIFVVANSRFWLPAVLLLLTPAVVGVSNTVLPWLKRPSTPPSRSTSDRVSLG